MITLYLNRMHVIEVFGTKEIFFSQLSEKAIGDNIDDTLLDFIKADCFDDYSIELYFNCFAKVQLFNKFEPIYTAFFKYVLVEEPE